MKLLLFWRKIGTDRRKTRLKEFFVAGGDGDWSRVKNSFFYISLLEQTTKALTTVTSVTEQATTKCSTASPPSCGSSSCTECLTEDNIPCHFPFVYSGESYNSCTDVGEPKLWCSTEPDYGSDNWGYCDETCDLCKGEI